MTLDLFAWQPPATPDTAPYVRGSDTSREAADRIRPALSHLEAVVFNAIKACRGHGATCEEIERKTSLQHQTASARIRGLSLKGAIALTGDKRPTSSGRSAGVYVTVWAEVA